MIGNPAIPMSNALRLALVPFILNSSPLVLQQPWDSSTHPRGWERYTGWLTAPHVCLLQSQHLSLGSLLAASKTKENMYGHSNVPSPQGDKTKQLREGAAWGCRVFGISIPSSKPLKVFFLFFFQSKIHK